MKGTTGGRCRQLSRCKKDEREARRWDGTQSGTGGEGKGEKDKDEKGEVSARLRLEGIR